MKELILREAPRGAVLLPADIAALFAETRAAIATRSTIVWGEHCSECAFPACYASCEFYTPRPDLHCRRFAQGLERVRDENAAATTAALSRISFRRWGKLEGAGPARLVLRDQAEAAERRADVLDATLAGFPAPRRLVNAAVYRLNERRKRRALGDALDAEAMFVIEAWLADAPAIPFTLTMAPWDKAEQGFFQHPFTLTPGYNRVVVSAEQITRVLPVAAPFAVQIEPVGDAPPTPIVFGLIDFVTLRAPLAALPAKAPAQTSKSRTAKCVVWDLDNTVWDGTLAEDGVEGLTLRPQAVDAIRMLDQRGVLNSVASKNDDAPARQALKHFGLAEYFLFPQINWGPKSDSLRRIAEAIDIDLDTFAFVDDQPFERGEVSAAHPMVRVFDANEVGAFATHPVFDVPVTPESKARRSMYRDEERRQDAASGAGGDYLAFLRRCEIKLEIAPITPASQERVYELTQRTNQLNVTGARLSREDVARIMSGEDAMEGFVLGCRDLFGDYGIIGFCALDRASGEVAAFFMSCRVQRKKVENGFFAWLGGRLAREGRRQIRVRYKKTQRNGASARMFEELGFAFAGDSNEGVFTRVLSDAWSDADIVSIDAQTPATPVTAA
jgi:FkbH-like protein